MELTVVDLTLVLYLRVVQEYVQKVYFVDMTLFHVEIYKSHHLMNVIVEQTSFKHHAYILNFVVHPPNQASATLLLMEMSLVDHI